MFYDRYPIMNILNNTIYDRYYMTNSNNNNKYLTLIYILMLKSHWSKYLWFNFC